MPIPHVYTLAGCVHAGLIAAGTLVLHSGFSPRSIYSAVEKHKITVISAIPGVFEYLADYQRKARFDLSSLRRCITGGELFDAARQAEAEKKLGVPLLQGYGLTESLPVLCSRVTDNVYGAMGIPGRKDISIKIAGPDGCRLPADEVGEIWIRSPTNMVGYYNKPAETKAVFHGDWLKTGDLGKVDAQGTLYFMGLKKHILKIRGNTASSGEIERAFLEHPRIRKASVSMCPTLTAELLLTEGDEITPAEIRKFCKARIARYKIPETIRLL